MPGGSWFRGTADDGAVSFVVGGSPPPTPPPIDLEAPTFYALAPGYSPRTVVGTGQPGAVVSLFVDDVLEDTEVVDQYGEWAIAVLRDPGSYDLTASQTYMGQTSETAGPVTMLIHAFPPGPDGGGGPGRRMVRDMIEEKKPPAPTPAPQAPALLRPFKTPKRWPSDG